MADTTPCPICDTPIHRWERYPNMLCTSCAGLARDEQGRPMRFSNESPLGTGFLAETEIDGVWRRTDGDTCFVNGRRCRAQEHRFGGIVVQVADA